MSKDRLYDLIKELDYTYDRVRYYGESFTQAQLIEKLDFWRTELRSGWGSLDDYEDALNEKDDKIAELTNELVDELRAELKREKAAHAQTKASLGINPVEKIRGLL